MSKIVARESMKKSLAYDILVAAWVGATLPLGYSPRRG